MHPNLRRQHFCKLLSSNTLRLRSSRNDEMVPTSCAVRHELLVPFRRYGVFSCAPVRENLARGRARPSQSERCASLPDWSTSRTSAPGPPSPCDGANCTRSGPRSRPCPCASCRPPRFPPRATASRRRWPCPARGLFAGVGHVVLQVRVLRRAAQQEPDRRSRLVMPHRPHPHRGELMHQGALGATAMHNWALRKLNLMRHLRWPRRPELIV